MSDQPAASGAEVRAKGLVKRYEDGRIVALDGVDLELREGAFTAICGPSGCGKTTLLNVLSAIDRPDEGEIHVAGRAIEALSTAEADAYRRGVVGLVFQLHNLLPNLTAQENVQVALFGTDLSPRQRVERAAELLARVGLTERLDSRPPKLSGGERQRVAVARALANRPRLLLADEPTGSLDSRSGDQLFGLLADLRAESGMTMVVVTHDPRVAARADRVIHMLDGKIAS